jgi:hypothetical protein
VLVSTAYWDTAIQLWDLGTGMPWRRLQYAAPSELGQHIPPLIAVSVDGRMLAVQGQGAELHLWEIATGKERQRICLPGDGIATLAFSPDGSTLAVANRSGAIRLWGLAENKVLARLEAGRLARDTHPALTFSSDGRRLATISNDTTILLWPLAVPVRSERESAWLPEKLWADLASADAGKAYRAVCALVANQRQAVPFLKDRLRPGTRPDPRRVAQLLRDLDNERFEVRENAAKQLEEFHESVERALREAQRSPTSVESRRRIERLLGKIDSGKLALYPDSLRAIRGLEVLERAGTREALAVLQALAKGAPEARLTQEAQRTLGRLAKRPPPGP